MQDPKLTQPQVDERLEFVRTIIELRNSFGDVDNREDEEELTDDEIDELFSQYAEAGCYYKKDASKFFFLIFFQFFQFKKKDDIPNRERKLFQLEKGKYFQSELVN